MSWRVAHAALAARGRAVPAMLRAAAAEVVPPPRLGLAGIRRVVTTGIGSSAAHARLLAYLLAEQLGCDARFRPLGAFVEPTPIGSCDDLLVVVSQGLTPNARLALADPAAWRHVVVLTATRAAEARAGGRADAADFLEHLLEIGVEVRSFAAGAEEYGTLMRVTGPVAGALAVMRYAHALAADAGRPQAMAACDADTLARAVLATDAAAEPLRVVAASGRLLGPLVLVASGDYRLLVENLRLKLLEGLLVPMPPVFDPLELCHGPFQQAHAGSATFLALTRPDAAREADLLARFGGMLDPTRHLLLPLAATLPLPFCVFEHEALVNELVLAGIAAHAIDQARWPGQGHDRALYAVGGADESATAVPGEHCVADRAADDGGWGAEGQLESRVALQFASRVARQLGSLAWPELAAALAAGQCCALVPLGATEQHGPHLPFATDTWIGDALALRLAERLPEAMALPTLPFGCSREHLAFPGTIDLRPATLTAVLIDVVASLAHHGFAGAFLFSAHGGNYGELAAMLPALRAAAAPMWVGAFTDQGAITATVARVAADAGIAPEVAGHHAGEAETSILMALRPDAVRTGMLSPGHTARVDDPQRLFYPSLRDHSTSGTVGDPRAATALRAAAYLDAWVDLLAAAYRRAKNEKYANGTQNA